MRTTTDYYYYFFSLFPTQLSSVQPFSFFLEWTDEWRDGVSYLIGISTVFMGWKRFDLFCFAYVSARRRGKIWSWKAWRGCGCGCGIYIRAYIQTHKLQGKRKGKKLKKWLIVFLLNIVGWLWLTWLGLAWVVHIKEGKGKEYMMIHPVHIQIFVCMCVCLCVCMCVCCCR